MRRESHIRICEGLGVQFPGSTRRSTTMGGTIAQSVSRYSGTSMRPSDNGRDGSSSGSNAENARQCIGWDVLRDGTPSCLSCGSTVYDRRPESKSRMRGDLHVRFCEGCALQAHGSQSPEMATAAKPSRQPRTESCVMSDNGHCEA
jgi:hypothetical protein